MSNGPIVKDVQHILLNKQKSPRRHGTPYPLTYSKDLADFDIWDHMFRMSYCKNLTMHQFAEPPALTLDLGCGSGHWAMEAAKQWQNSTIIGFDIVCIQPNLSSIEQFKPLSRQINWVYGDVLDGLPFPSNLFDFIRIAGMGLAIPEDQWQPVLEEVYRVLKLGGVLEIIEEDLIFPSPSSQLQKPRSPTSIPMSPLIESPTLAQHSKLPKKISAFFLEKSNYSSERIRVSPDSSTSSIAEAANIKSNSKLTNLLPLLNTLRRTSSANLTVASTESYVDQEHPQDHTRLKAAWDSMLTTRFLSPNLLTVLPFYLTSASFSVKPHPPILVPLPPNSGVSMSSLKSIQSMGSLRNPDRLGSSMVDFHPTSSNRSVKTDGFSIRTSFPAIPRQPPPWDTMHLAKVTSVIKGCKEAIWLEYKKLYLTDALNILARTAPDEEDYLSQPPDCAIHRAFEVDWNNWDYDMTDRMGMRKNLLVHTAWAQITSEDDQPPSQKWRDKLDGKHDSENSSPHLVAAYDPDNLCRSIRTFTARKS